MKFRRILTVLGCFVLVLMCTFTFAGCGEIDASKDEILNFVQSDEVLSSFDGRAYHFDFYTQFGDTGLYKDGYVKMSGEIVPNDGYSDAKIYVEYHAEDVETGEINSLKTTYYVKDGKFYNTKTEVITGTANDTWTAPMLSTIDDKAVHAKEFILGVFGYGDDSELLLKKKGEMEKGNVEFFLDVKSEEITNHVYAKYSNNQLVEALYELNADGLKMKLNFKEFGGKIDFPSFEKYKDLTE